MYFYVSKFLQWFIYPYHLALLLLALAYWQLRRGRLAAARRLLLFALSLLVLPALPIVAQLTFGPLERQYAVRRVEDYPAADAIVLLGGSVGRTVAPRIEAEETRGARVYTAARLYHANKAPWVVVSGGLPYLGTGGQERSEASDLREILIGMKVPASAILMENASRTTSENAEKSAALLRNRQIKRILLVTSAFHLLRAVHEFERYGITVEPVPTSFEMLETSGFDGKVLPNLTDLTRTSSAIKEYVGSWVDRYKP